MMVTVSTENNNKKIKIGEFDSHAYASIFVDAVLKAADEQKIYCKVIVELQEEEK